MVRTDYKTILAEMQTAIDKDQLFVVRDLLEITDKVADKNNTIKKFYGEHEDILKTLREAIDKTEELLFNLRTEENWTKCAAKKGSTIYFRKNPDSPFIFTKLETVFETTPDDVVDLFTKIVALFNETDLMPQWFPRKVMKSNEMTQQVTKFSKVCVAKIGFPMPVSLILSPREAYIYGQGWDMSERSQVVITCSTLSEGDMCNGVETPAPSKGYSPYIFESAYYFELSDRGIIFKIIQCMDLKSKAIPPFILNMASKGTLPFEMLKNLKKRLDDFEGSEWEKRVKASPEIYGEIGVRLRAVLEKQYGIVEKPLRLEDANDVASKMSLVSSSRKKKKGVMSRVSRGFRKMSKSRSKFRSRGKSGGVKNFSKNTKRSFANLETVELYDFEVEDEVEEKEKKPEGILQIIVYYLVLLLVKLFDAAGKKQKLEELQPKLSKRYPQLFIKED